MDFDFWDNCWARPSQPFHLTQPHHYLLENFESFFATQKKVLLPLCGKTQDLNYLAQNNVKAVGVEFNPAAVDSFFDDSQLAPTISTLAPGKLYQTKNLDIWLADFFNVTPDNTGHFGLIFDRAAIIALPDDVRQQYANHLITFLADGGEILLVTMDYFEPEMSGPPFLVTEQELNNLFPNTRIEELNRVSILDSHPRWRELELSRLDEVLYKIQLG